MAKNISHARNRTLATALILGLFVSLSGCASKSAFESNLDNELLVPEDLASNDGIDQNYSHVLGSQGVILAANATSSSNSTANTRMNLREISLYALEKNPAIDIARWQAKGAEASVELANVKWRPKVEFSVSTGPEITYASSTDTSESHLRREASVYLSQLIFDFGKTNADVDWAASMQNSAQKRLAYKISATIYEVAEIYLMVLEHDLLIANARNSERAHRETYRLVKISEDGGNATLADVQKAYTRLEGARTQTIELISARQRTASEFRRIIGFAPGNLTLPKVSSRTNNSLNISNMNKYISDNFFLQALLDDATSLEHQRAALERGYLPQVFLEGNAVAKENVTGVAPWTADARIQVAIRGSLYDGGDKSAKIMQIEAAIGENRARYRKAQYDFENEVAETARILRTAKKKSGTISRRIKASEDVVRLYTEQFKAGSRGIFELLDAQQELSAARAERISNRFDVLRAQYAAQKYLGSLVPNVLGRDARE